MSIFKAFRGHKIKAKTAETPETDRPQGFWHVYLHLLRGLNGRLKIDDSPGSVV
jgi:hypothetical protein